MGIGAVVCATCIEEVAVDGASLTSDDLPAVS